MSEFNEMIRDAVLASDPNASAEHIARTVAGVAAHADWRDLTWLSRDLASGSLAAGLAARATAISAALKQAESSTPAIAPTNTDEAQAIRAAFDLTPEQWRATPPETKLRLRAGLAEKQAEKKAATANAEGLKAKIDAKTATPAKKLEYARLTQPEAPTKAMRRDPVFIRSQQERASTAELEKMIRGHEQIYASGQYPQVMRDDHRRHADRLRAIIAEREAS